MAHHKCPERHCHDVTPKTDTSFPDRLVSAILILLITLAPCFDPFRPVPRKFEFSCLVFPVVYLFQITQFNFKENQYDFFSFLFVANACPSNQAWVNSSSLRKLACIAEPCVWRPFLLRVDYKEFSPP